ncbi:MAG: hypothetical protein CMF63_00215, partial [Magnetovibrio sp.]|nr:hypothetical protein [Magnetovibrio sp.]
ISFPDRRHPGAKTDAGRLNSLYEKTRAALPARSSKAAEAGKAGASREPPPSGLKIGDAAEKIVMPARHGPAQNKPRIKTDEHGSGLGIHNSRLLLSATERAARPEI